MKDLTLRILVSDDEADALKKNPGLINCQEEDVKVQRYIALPGEFCTPQRYKGKHPNISVADSRLSLSLEVLKVAKELNLQVKNNDQGFIGDLTFNETEALYRKLQEEQRMFFLSPWYFNRFLSHLTEGINERREVKYEDRELVTRERLIEIKLDIMERRDPWRAIWLCARFDSKEGKLTIAHPIVQENGEIKIVPEHLDGDTLMVDKTPGINIEDWVSNNYTPQGLVKNTVKEGRDYSRYPRKGSVPRFYALSDWVSFNCFENHGGSDSSLGNWPARLFSTGNQG